MTETVQQDLISRLAQHKKLGSAPPDELAWLAPLVRKFEAMG